LISRPLECRSLVSRRGGGQALSSGSNSSIAGSLILYFSLDQLPRSVSLQRSLQNGKSGEDSESVGVRQIGHRHFMAKE